MLRAALMLFALSFAATAGAQEFSSLEERMSDAEFRAAGLDRLSPEELASLNEWLRTRLTAQQAAAARSGEGFRASDGLFNDDSMDRGDVESRYAGTFTGWSQGSVIKLENGQEWKINEPASFRVPPVESPMISIKPALLGSWLMKVEGYNRSVRVVRVR